ncbi:MAG TPA: biotin--[acetyl-CoA-carboxylase] ligase [Thermoanaerobaculia bacterium]|nr:biotin--[acetyl-CoA-carboxylase] ligase [Thermoanaerobaculia bacterium]
MDFDRYIEELVEKRARRGPENVIILPRVASTNELARSIVAEYEGEGEDLQPLLVLAFEQSGGRGRHGRGWASPRGKGIYATLVTKIADAEALQTLPLLVGVGLCRVLSTHLASPCRLKWPNDLLIASGAERRKIGGILIEALVRPDGESRVIVGFGINHGHGEDELPVAGTSVSLQGGTGVTLEGLTWDLVAGIEREMVHLGDLAYAVESYRSWSVHRPGERLVCRTGDEVVEGTFLGFDERGFLLLESDGRELRLSAGEVIE